MRERGFECISCREQFGRGKLVATDVHPSAYVSCYALRERGDDQNGASMIGEKHYRPCFYPKQVIAPMQKIKKSGYLRRGDGILDYPENKRESTEAVRLRCGDEIFRHDIGLMATSIALRGAC